ncbi:MAG TPA: pre-peptidase C-terminal domain-containing protein [Pyrinomonadaceae bacterium]|nr:pre-peptidase C-terminal domain-containing protein [Pyrinomonadaceae bacterium]
MKFANVHSATNSSRFALRLAFFSFLCLLLFAMSSPRFGVAPAAGAATTTQQKRAVGKKSDAQAEKSSQGVRAESVKPVEKSAGDPGNALQPAAVCAQNTLISIGATVTGTLATGDCANPAARPGSPQVGTVVDEYTFDAQAGQQIAITLSAPFDTYLYLLRPDGTRLADNDDDAFTSGQTTSNSRIPRTLDADFIVLPTTGRYSILASSFSTLSTGGTYTLTLTGGRQCSSRAITPSATPQQGELRATDCTNPFDSTDGTVVDTYTFNGTMGQQVSIVMASAEFDTFLYLLTPDGEFLAADDDGGGGTTARIPRGSGFIRLPMTGTYTILANSADDRPEEFGNYTLTLSTAAAPCPSTALTAGQTTGGSLDTGDCRLPLDGSFLEAYTFNGTANQQITVTMSASTAGLNPYLYLLLPNGEVLSEGGDGTSTTVRLPTSGTFTLAETGTYTILATSFRTGQTGSYTLRLTNTTACTTTLASGSRDVPGNGGTFNATFTTQPGCPGTVSSNSAFITVNPAFIDANGAGTVTYTVQPNPTTTPRTGTITINGQTFTVNQGAACTYAVYPTVRPFRQDGGTNGRFTVITQSGCTWTATSNAPWITITEGAGNNAGTGRVRYTVAANNTTATRSGTITVTGGTGGVTHTVTQTSAGTTPQVQFSGNAEFTVNENDPSRGAVITVTRTGDTTGAVTVEYATLDDPAEVPCDPNIRRSDGSLFPQGTAYARCDYASSIDTLTFNPGETTKTIRIPLIDDVFQEGNERFALSLFNPQGALLGTAASATITLVSDDTALPNSNPINQISFFVRQHYLDFLDREPEAGEPWTGVLTRCGNIFTGPEANTDCDRIAVSGAFFGSPEYRIKGLFVFLHYKAAFGSANNPFYVPQYDEFVRDARRVSGLTAEEVIAKRLDFSEDFLTTRANVANIFAGTSNAQFVDRILGNLGIAMTNPDPASGETRNSLVSGLDAGTRTRPQVLRLIVESNEAIAAQFNRAFVAIQYYGYLRRTPEPQGYLNNLNALNATNNSRQLINGFLNSIEYRLRFGANTTNP